MVQSEKALGIRYGGLLLIILTEVVSLIAIWVAWEPLAALTTAVAGIVMGVVTYKTTGSTPFIVLIVVLLAIPTTGVIALLFTARFLPAGLLAILFVGTGVTCLFGMISQ